MAMPLGLARKLGTVTVAMILATMVVAGQTKKPAAKPAPAKPAAAEAPDFAVPFKVGEVLSYDISWSSFVTGGSATLSVKERRPAGTGHTGYYIAAEADPRPLFQKLYPFQYKADTLLDTKTLLPIQASTFSSERGRTRTKTTKFLPNGTTIDFQMQTSTLVHAKRQVPPHPQDALSVLYFLRSIPFKQGDSIRIPVTDGGDVFYARVTFGSPSPIKTAAGTFSAWQLQITLLDEKGQAAGKKLTLWLSADARRLPVRFDIGLPVGSFVLTLSHIAP
jgi:hypothetical protein